eukprot:TRINITY_DN4344_c1_g3_i1.p1 TRINITY_DN4344_c1_g3~~TRINITY_DN4344_c1_g3_i1.p1  ORF type:complete len:179 (+),score=36.96 TRINITY_DN4344_c1_g3_i1:420-956(+)
MPYAAQRARTAAAAHTCRLGVNKCKKTKYTGGASCGGTSARWQRRGNGKAAVHAGQCAAFTPVANAAHLQARAAPCDGLAEERARDARRRERHALERVVEELRGQREVVVHAAPAVLNELADDALADGRQRQRRAAAAAAAAVALRSGRLRRRRQQLLGVRGEEGRGHLRSRRARAIG